MSKIRQFLIDLLENHESPAGKVFGGLLVISILASVALFILETMPEFEEHHRLFNRLDNYILLFFATEYFLRIFIARNRSKFIFSPLGIIDLIVILPLFGIFLNNIIFLRSFRLLEILRIMKVVRYSELMRTFLRSFKHYKEELKIFVLTFSVIWVLASFGIYTLEYTVNPDIDTIGKAFWWALVSMSTVGYGDIVPITVGGKVLAGFVILLGLGTIAIMTATLTKIFIDHFFGKRMHKCEFCHFPHHDHDSKFCKNCGGQLDTTKLMAAEMIHPREKSQKK